MEYFELRKKIVDYSRLMYNERLVSATSGNISLRLPDREDAILITPSSESYATMTEERIVIISLDGDVLYAPEGARPSSEWRLHSELYKANKETKAVIHTHSPYATAFAVLHETIPLILIEMKPWLGGEIPLSDYAPAGTEEVGQLVVKAIENKKGCLMANHGVVAIADTLELAYTRASYIEDAAKIYHMAREVGKPYIIGE